MGRIQSSVGLVTGVPIEETVNQLMQLNGIPRDRLISRNNALQQEQGAVTELMTLVVGTQLTTDRLGQKSLYSATTVSSSKSDVLSARSTGTPRPGSYSFIPVQQAQNQQLTSSLFASGDQKLSSGEVVIRTGGFLDNSVSLDSLNGGAGVSRGKIRVTDRSGASQEIDLRFAQNAADVVDAINAKDSLSVVAKLDGDRFTLTDVSGATASNLTVEEVGGGTTAADLGLAGISTASASASGTSVQSLSNNTALRALLDGRGLDLPKDGVALRLDLQDGSRIDFESELDDTKASLGALLDEINAAGEGKISARIASNGKSIEIQDLTSGTNAFTVASPAGSLAEQLGINGQASGDTAGSDRLVAGLGDVLLSSLNGGAGYEALGSLSITDRAGATTTVDLSTAETLNDVIEAINGTSVEVQARLNRTKTGIEIVDTSGSTANDLVIADGDATNTATKLGIAASISADSVDSGSLNLQFVNRNTTLTDFNRGAPLELGSFRLTDSAGKTSSLNLSSRKPETIGDVIDAINGLAVDVEARINDSGDGIVLIDTADGEAAMQVEDLGTGSTAARLGLAGTSKTVQISGEDVQAIDGSRTIRIATTADTTIADLASQINDLEASPVNANLLNLNNTGVRLILGSANTGSAGRVAIDSDIGISFSETTKAQDALIAFGASESSGGVLVSSATNTFTGVIEDVEINIRDTSTSPVTVTVAESTDNVSKQIDAFVKQYNTLRDRLATSTAFDASTNSVGILFGSNAALRVDLAYSSLLSTQVTGSGSIKSLGQVGLRLNENGRLEFDKAKFDSLRESDPSAVQEFFRGREVFDEEGFAKALLSNPEADQADFTKQIGGFANKAKAVADSLAGVETGSLLNRSNALQNQIEQNNGRIGSLDVRLDRQRERLLKQFYTMEQTISKLQQNLTALNQLQIIPPLGSS